MQLKIYKDLEEINIDDLEIKNEFILSEFMFISDIIKNKDEYNLTTDQIDKLQSDLFFTAMKIQKYLGYCYSTKIIDKNDEYLFPMNLNLMADFGDSLFWLQEEPASCCGGYEGIFPLLFPEFIKIKLYNWYSQFDENAFNDNFDWKNFHSTGMEIGKIIKHYYDGMISLKYWKCFEDPNHDNEMIEIT